MRPSLFSIEYFTVAPQNATIKSLALEAVALVSRNKECVSEIAACDIQGSYFVALKDPDLRDQQLKVLETLSGLLNSQEMIKEAQNKGWDRTSTLQYSGLVDEHISF